MSSSSPTAPAGSRAALPETASSRPLIVIPDCNVLIHGKALRSLPWEEWARDAIEIVIVGPVLGELDAVKNRPGRPGRIARDVSTEIRELLNAPDYQDVLRETNPRVTRRLWLGQKESRDPLREGLDVAHGDQAIINRALWWLDSGRDVVFLTDDTLAAANAHEFGLPYRLLPSEWLRPAETDETQKEAARLKAEIAKLQAAEPQLQGWFEDAAGQRIERIDTTLQLYDALAPEVVEALIARVSHANPMVRLEPPSYAVSKYEEEYAAWLERVRSQFSDLHLRWRRRREWPAVTFMGVNKGNRPASRALVELAVGGNFAIQRPRKWTGDAETKDKKRRLAELSIAMPPPPPRPLMAMASLFSAFEKSPFGPERAPYLDPLPHLQRARDADAFYWRTGGQEKLSDRLELECENWRHQREPEDFRFDIRGSDAQTIEGVVTGTLSAANLTTAIQVRLPVRIAFKDQPIEPIAEQMVQEFERLSPHWRKAQRMSPLTDD